MCAMCDPRCHPMYGPRCHPELLEHGHWIRVLSKNMKVLSRNASTTSTRIRMGRRFSGCPRMSTPGRRSLSALYFSILFPFLDIISHSPYHHTRSCGRFNTNINPAAHSGSSLARILQSTSSPHLAQDASQPTAFSQRESQVRRAAVLLLAAVAVNG